MKRYDLERFQSCGATDAAMIECDEGDWVKYEDALESEESLRMICADLRRAVEIVGARRRIKEDKTR